jgi:hypothetical protein
MTPFFTFFSQSQSYAVIEAFAGNLEGDFIRHYINHPMKAPNLESGTFRFDWTATCRIHGLANCIWLFLKYRTLVGHQKISDEFVDDDDDYVGSACFGGLRLP